MAWYGAALSQPLNGCISFEQPAHAPSLPGGRQWDGIAVASVAMRGGTRAHRRLQRQAAGAAEGSGFARVSSSSGG
jgi:hypothetical protein